METPRVFNRLHPLVAAAAVSVIVLSLVGVAAITGVISTSHGMNGPATASAPSSAPLPSDSPAVVAAVAANAPPPPNAPPPSNICINCGRVESVQAVRHQAPATGLGAVTGALLGGVLGHQVGGGNGRSLATVAGAVGGGVAGNEIEKNSHSTTSYQVRVRMEDGRIRNFSYAEMPEWRNGDPVRVSDGRLVARD
ncbi:MAG: glycine zipper 2TM domain-containing protein [Burkholderiaceae bacterium]|nr:glycine zipper 2TM domain-containing protein [Burkholderiaceae bacterium]